LRTATTAEGESDQVEVGEMNDREMDGFELLPSEPTFVAWLEPDEDDEDEPPERRLR
jgi:hypothetical protein